MKYHNITKADMKNGDGLRVVLWLSGCNHHCKGCQNPITWDPNDGLDFTYKEIEEIYSELDKPYISGITLSGGDPLHPANRADVSWLIHAIKQKYPDKTVWMYTGYTFEDILKYPILVATISQVDVLVDGRFVEELKDVTYPWAGSTNQRVIDVKESLSEGTVVYHAGCEKRWNQGEVQSGENCSCCQ